MVKDRGDKLAAEVRLSLLVLSNAMDDHYNDGDPSTNIGRAMRVLIDGLKRYDPAEARRKGHLASKLREERWAAEDEERADLIRMGIIEPDEDSDEW